MNKRYLSTQAWQIMTFVITLLFLTVFSAQATTHTIKFGGTLGLTYSPSELNVSIGDTVIWEGAFSSHPLSSTTIPQGAASFHMATGTSFSYPVQVAGTYNYRCDFHFSSGMTGSFTATVSSVQDPGITSQPNSFQLAQNYPNPFNSRTIIQFNLPVAQHVKLKIYSLTGAEIATLVDKIMPAGEFTVAFDAAKLASGVYFYQLVTEKFIDTKRLVLAK